jgi:hypothetical protein
MVAYKLMSTVFTPVILLPLAFFPVSGYVGALAMGAFEFYCYFHNLGIHYTQVKSFNDSLILIFCHKNQPKRDFLDSF